MIQVILYVLITSYLIEDTVSATFHEFIQHFPEKIAVSDFLLFLMFNKTNNKLFVEHVRMIVASCFHSLFIYLLCIETNRSRHNCARMIMNNLFKTKLNVQLCRKPEYLRFSCLLSLPNSGGTSLLNPVHLSLVCALFMFNVVFKIIIVTLILVLGATAVTLYTVIYVESLKTFIVFVVCKDCLAIQSNRIATNTRLKVTVCNSF